jgi:hypothetical protein
MEMNKSNLINYSTPDFVKSILAFVLFLWSGHTSAQQFNSDSWLSKPHGMMTIIPTFGERSSMLMNTVSLLPKWEFTMAAYLYNEDKDNKTDDGYSTSFYAKYMIYEDKMKTGGFAVKAGTGTFPGTIDPEVREKDAFKTFWMNAPVTFPFFDNKLSWDIMPGVSMTKNYGPDETTGWAFTYSTRVAYNPWGPKFSFVAEIFGAEGETGTIPEYKTGLRYDVSQYATFAFTYGQEFTDNKGAGFEIGAMLFTPPFAKLGGAGKKSKTEME